MKNFKIGDKITRVPLIQGGMGVGISLGRLAGSVAKAGGVGIISTAQIGYREEDFDRNPAAANERAIAGEMKKARDDFRRRNHRIQYYGCTERICISRKGCSKSRRRHHYLRCRTSHRASGIGKRKSDKDRTLSYLQTNPQK